MFLPQKTKLNKNPNGHKKSFGSIGYIYYLGCGDGIMNVCIHPNASKCIHYICAISCVSIIHQENCKNIKNERKDITMNPRDIIEF